MSINKAVFMVRLAVWLTLFTVWYVSRKMSDSTSRDKPGKIQAAVEIFYDVAANTVTKRTSTTRRSRPSVGSLPRDDVPFSSGSVTRRIHPAAAQHGAHFGLFGLNLPTFALYAATANVAIR